MDITVDIINLSKYLFLFYFNFVRRVRYSPPSKINHLRDFVRYATCAVYGRVYRIVHDVPPFACANLTNTVSDSSGDTLA